MSTDDLVDILEEADVSPTSYRVLGIENECLCIISEGQEWRVFLSERGERHEEKAFDTEDSACTYFLRRIFQLVSR